MGEFEDCIGEVPGRSSSLFALYTDLSKMETKLELTGVHLRHLPSKADSWRGAAANAFEVALKNEVKQAQRLESGADKAADAILKYAHAMQSTEKEISSARAQMRALDRQVDAVADDEREKKVDELTPRAQSIARGAKQAINDLHRAGEVCAAELRAALHLEAVEPNKEGNNKGELHVLDRRDVDRVNAELEQMGFRSVSQGEIGDCYLLATLMAMMRTPEGRRLLRNAIEPHYDKHGRQDGFLVTVYEDPENPGRKRTVFVDRIYRRGANGERPGLVSVLESAYGQMYPGGTRGDSFFGATGISSGLSSAVMEEMTGKDSTVYRRKFYEAASSDAYSDEEGENIRQAIKNHKPVTASSYPIGGKDYPEITINGHKEKVEIPQGHAYVVVSADATGVTVRNPWGHSQDSHDNSRPDMAEFKLTWKQFSRDFRSVSIGGGYPR